MRRQRRNDQSHDKQMQQISTEGDDWVGKVIHWEICKKLKFDHTTIWYMHNPAPVLENNTHELLWDFNIEMDHVISTGRPDLIIINNKKKKKKKTCIFVD